MRVAAFETPVVVPEEQRSGIKKPLAGVRAIGEAPFDDGRNAEPVVPLLEGPIGRPCAAEDFMHAPAVSGRQCSLGERLVGRRARASAEGLDCTLHGQKIAIFPKSGKGHCCEYGAVRRAAS